MKKAEIRLQKEVDDFNKQFKVGEHVQVTDDFGQINIDTIRAPAVVMCGSSTAWLNKNGSYLMERVSKLPF